MKVLLLRFAGPLISFGGPLVDQHGVIQRFPGRSMLAGLLANALGWHHGDFERLSALQERLRFAARVDRGGEPFIDYHTVDLGQPGMLPEQHGWTTHGRLALRAGAKENAEGTHIRFRHYLADSVHTVAIALEVDGTPSLEALAEALQFPARPLFLGRKTCLPTERIFLGVVDAGSPLEALATCPRHARGDTGPLPAAWFPGDAAESRASGVRSFPVSDDRDWPNQVHVGRRLMREGLLEVSEVAHG